MKSAPANIVHRIIAKVTESNDLAPVHPGHCRMTINAPEIASEAKPGQFIHVLPPSSELMLRRPFSILSTDTEKGLITILFRIIGAGTRLISEINSGDSVDIIGPLGNGFPIDTENPALLVGGGIGIPPLVFLSDMMIGRKFDPDPGSKKPISVFLGAKDLKSLVCYDDFHEMGIDPILATEDGSAGIRGLVTDALEGAGKRLSPETVVYACGPVPMLKAVAKWTSDRSFTCWTSLESKIGCGIGACLGCSIPVRDESGLVVYKRVCCDGPAFDAHRVAFDLM